METSIDKVTVKKGTTDNWVLVRSLVAMVMNRTRFLRYPSETTKRNHSTTYRIKTAESIEPRQGISVISRKPLKCITKHPGFATCLAVFYDAE
jgi:hypothetical protein